MQAVWHFGPCSGIAQCLPELAKPSRQTYSTDTSCLLSPSKSSTPPIYSHFAPPHFSSARLYLALSIERSHSRKPSPPTHQERAQQVFDQGLTPSCVSMWCSWVVTVFPAAMSPPYCSQQAWSPPQLSLRSKGGAISPPHNCHHAWLSPHSCLPVLPSLPGAQGNSKAPFPTTLLGNLFGEQTLPRTKTFYLRVNVT